MKTLILILGSTLLLFSLNGCVPEKEYIYVYRDCPKLQSIKPERYNPDPLTIKYVVKDIKEIEEIEHAEGK